MCYHNYELIQQTEVVMLFSIKLHLNSFKSFIWFVLRIPGWNAWPARCNWISNLRWTIFSCTLIWLHMYAKCSRELLLSDLIYVAMCSTNDLHWLSPKICLCQNSYGTKIRYFLIFSHYHDRGNARSYWSYLAPEKLEGDIFKKWVFLRQKRHEQSGCQVCTKTKHLQTESIPEWCQRVFCVSSACVPLTGIWHKKIHEILDQ